VKLSEHDLRQLDEDALRQLPEAALRTLSATLLADLKEARERLQQHPGNSSRPPSSRAPWERGQPAADAPEPAVAPAAQPQAGAGADGAPARRDAEAAAPPTGAAADGAAGAGATTKRKPGKQPGAPGMGRTQLLRAHTHEVHRPTVCAVCGEGLGAEAPAVPYTGFQSLDLHWDDPAAPGLRLWVVDHQYLEVTCPCGHHTRARPLQGEVDPTLERVQLREWRLVGPGLATLIVALSLRFRLSRARIQEFLHAWLGIQLSLGTIHQTLHEAAAVVAPAEATLIAEVQGSGLLHADETSWPQHDQLLWLWVFITATTTLYVIAGRGKATVTRVLAGFTGWLMSDGWFSYRGYPQRLRCWAHLRRLRPGAGGVLRSARQRLRAPGAHHARSADGRDLCGARRPATRCGRAGPGEHPGRATRRAAPGLHRLSGVSPREDPGPSGRTAHRLGGHLPGASPSRAAADQ
jgi:hypothetical protein